MKLKKFSTNESVVKAIREISDGIRERINRVESLDEGKELFQAVGYTCIQTLCELIDEGERDSYLNTFCESIKEDLQAFHGNDGACESK